jgi:hypothetical protein
MLLPYQHILGFQGHPLRRSLVHLAQNYLRNPELSNAEADKQAMIQYFEAILQPFDLFGLVALALFVLAT